MDLVFVYWIGMGLMIFYALSLVGLALFELTDNYDHF